MRLGLALLIAVTVTSPALAGTEEFSTFTVVGQQQDDESLLDHLLNRPPRAWRYEWEHSTQALRTSQGCLTSGEWLIDTRLKLRAPLGQRARFGLEVRDDQSDRYSVQYFDLSFRFPTEIGTPGFFFRPLYDKSRQDLGLFWEVGDDTADVARLTFTIEDAFNNLWAFRQSQVGDDSEPYERHPYEPALWVRLTRPALRFETAAQWLTPSRKRFQTFDAQGVDPRETLWGALGFASVEGRLLGLDLEVTSHHRQTHSGRTLTGSETLYGGNFRRQWTIETSAARALGPAVVADIRWLYQGGTEHSDPPYASRRFDTVDRVVAVEARAGRSMVTRIGGLYDRITVGASGDPAPGYGTRNESRAYFGFSIRFGAVWIDAVEGIELDPEPYDVWAVHDKAFVHLQTRF